MALSGKPELGAYDSPHSRLFNVDCAGRTKTANIWHTNQTHVRGSRVSILPGTPVGISLATVTATSNFRPISAPVVGGSGESVLLAPRTEFNMVVPVVYTHEGWVMIDETARELETRFGNVDLKAGAAIRLGIMLEPCLPAHANVVADALTVPEQFHRLPRATLFLGA